MKRNNSERGQILIVIVLAIVGLAGMAGLVVDGGNAFLDRRNAQNAADSAVLASALARVRGDSDWTGVAIASAAENGYNNDGVKNTVVLYSPPSNGPYAGDVNYIQVTITSHVTTYFARIIGRSELINIVEATARTKMPEMKQLLNGAAVVSLAPSSDCNNNRSFWVHGEATLDISGGSVFINSSNRTCALVQNGSGSVRLEPGYSIEVVGGASIQKPLLLTPGVSVGVAPIPYPPPFFMPELGCGGKMAQVSADGSSMSPGNWDEEFPPEGVSRLESGIYCLNDGMDIQHDLEGSNVVFKVEDGEVRFGSNAKIVLDAPNSGKNAGLLIYVPMENHNKVVLNGGSGSSFKGTILAPGSPVIFKGLDSSTGFRSQIIGYTIEADGSSNIKIVYNDAQNYDSLTMPEVQFSE
jgi:Flp pilus assembly protein TadG